MPLLREKTYTIEDIYNLPEGQRAELIDGHLYDMAPPSRVHQKLVGSLYFYSEGGDIMKKKINDLHHKIDIFSTTLFLYCCGVFLLLNIFECINNDAIQAALSIILPILFCSRKTVFTFNHFFHSIFRFRR